MVVSTLPGTGARKSAPQPGGISARTASMSVARASARYRSRARASHGRSTASFGCPGGTASRRSAWVSSHSGDTANRLMVRSSLPTSIRSATVTSFRPQTKEYAPGRRAHRMAYMTAPAPARQPDAARQDPPARATYRSVFAVREFRVMAAAMFMYVLGFEFEVLGLSVLVFAQTESALWTALAFSAGFAPQAVGGALFTALAARLPPRLVIGAGLLTRAVPGLVIGWWPGLPIPVMLALVAAAAATAPVVTAALSGMLPELLEGDRYILGRSVFSLAGSATQLAGLGAGGAILAVVPARWLLV